MNDPGGHIHKVGKARECYASSYLCSFILPHIIALTSLIIQLSGETNDCGGIQGEAIRLSISMHRGIQSLRTEQGALRTEAACRYFLR